MTLQKSTPAQIRARFDADVERFSNLDTGQVAAIDSPLHMELLTRAAAGLSPDPKSLLDIGCGAGNYSLKLLQHLPHPNEVSVTLIDLSPNMLRRAERRLRGIGVRDVHPICGDIRDIPLGERTHDIAMAAQCLHHLREDEEWEAVFAAVFRSLRPGGTFWIADSLEYHQPRVRHIMRERWGEYLESINGPAYRDKVFRYVEDEDSPRPLSYQLSLMGRVGFIKIDVLHVHNRFASFGGVRPEGASPEGA